MVISLSENGSIYICFQIVHLCVCEWSYFYVCLLTVIVLYAYVNDQLFMFICKWLYYLSVIKGASIIMFFVISIECYTMML